MNIVIKIIFLCCCSFSLLLTAKAGMPNLHAFKIEKDLPNEIQTLTPDTLAKYFFSKSRKSRDSALYDSSIIYTKKALKLYEKNTNLRMILDCYNTLGLNFLSLSNYNESEAYFDTAKSFMDEYFDSNDSIKAEIYNNLGVLYQRQNETKQALTYHSSALEIKLKLFKDFNESIAMSYNNMGLCYSEQGDFDRAQSYYQKALNIRIKVFGKYHFSVATTYNNLGVNFSDQGDYRQALQYHEKALHIRTAIFKADHVAVASSYNNLGICYQSLGANSLASEYFKKALKIWKKAFGEKHVYIAGGYQNIGLCYKNEGNYSESISYYKKSLRIFLERFGEKHSYVAAIYNNIGTSYSLQWSNDKALGYFKKALTIRSELYGDNHPTVASSLNNIAIAYQNQGDNDQAIKYYEKALKQRLSIFGENSYPVAETYINLGAYYIDLGEHDLALPCLTRAVNILKEIFGESHSHLGNVFANFGHNYFDQEHYDKASNYYRQALNIWHNTLPESHPNIGLMYRSIGSCYAEKSDYQKALKYFQKAITSLAKNFSDTSIFANPISAETNSKIYLTGTLADKAYYMAKLYFKETQDLEHLKKALQTYHLVIGIIDSLRFEFVSKRDLEELSGHSSELYGEAILIALKLYDITNQDRYLNDAFYIIEKSKSFSLLKTLNEINAREFADLPKDLLKQEQDLKQSISYYENELTDLEFRTDSVSKLILARYRHALFDKRSALETLIKNFEINYKKYYDLKYQINVISLKEVQEKILDTTNVLLNYFVCDSAIIIMGLTKKTCIVHQIKNDSLWRSNLSLILGSINNEGAIYHLRSEVYNYATGANWLYQKLIPKEILADKSVTKLLISPSRALKRITL